MATVVIELGPNAVILGYNIEGIAVNIIVLLEMCTLESIVLVLNSFT